MKKLILGLVGATALFSTQASAFDDCCWDPCGCFEVGAAALYWKACHCPFEYAAHVTPPEYATRTTTPISVTPTNGRIGQVLEVSSVKPSNDWGVRVWGTYRPDSGCWFTTLDWTYVQPTDSETVNADGASLFIFIPEQGAIEGALDAKAKIRSRYNRINLRFGYYLHQGCDLNFYTFAGIRWVDIKHSQKVDYTPSNFTTESASRKVKMEWDGAALELGAGLDYNLGCGIGLAGYFGGLAAVGDQKLHASYTAPVSQTSPTGADITYKTFTNCLPGVEARLGLNYTYSCGCGTLVGEIGYEIDYYFNVLSFEGEFQTSTCENFGFAGPYLSLSFCF